MSFSLVSRNCSHPTPRFSRLLCPPVYPYLWNQNLMPASKSFVLWQWNCRGFQSKRATLQAYITTTPTPPAVIALQETRPATKLCGYQSFQDPRFPTVATLVQRNLRAGVTSLPVTRIPHLLVTIFPCKPSQPLIHTQTTSQLPHPPHARYSHCRPQPVNYCWRI